MTKPTVGRIVHYYTDDPVHQSNGGGHGPYAAVVVQVFATSPEYDTMANLKVLRPFGPDYDAGSVMEQSQALARGHTSSYWVWPRS